MNKLICSIGEVLWDVYPKCKTPGGAPANFAYHTIQNNHRAILVSSVGDDNNGNELLAFLQAKGIHTEYIQISDKYPTGTVQVSISEGIPNYNIYENTAWDNIVISEKLLELAQSADAICFGTLASRNSISQNTICSFLDSSSKSCLKILDVNLRQQYYSKELLEEYLSRADILKINDEELDIIAELFNLQGDEAVIIETLRTTFAIKAVLLTLGAQGAIYYAENEKYHCSAVKNIDVVSTVGCGDSFTAAFVCHYLNGATPQEAIDQAAKTASFVAQKADAMPDYSD